MENVYTKSFYQQFESWVREFAELAGPNGNTSSHDIMGWLALGHSPMQAASWVLCGYDADATKDAMQRTTRPSDVDNLLREAVKGPAYWRLAVLARYLNLQHPEDAEHWAPLVDNVRVALDDLGRE